MAFDGYFISKMILEIKPKIINKRVDKIVGDDNYLQFKLGREYLTFTTSQQSGLFYLSDEVVVSNDNDFLVLLRKHLLNYKLREINQISLDRIVVFEFQGIDLIKGLVEKKLILEAYGRNFNLILTENDKIISAFRLIHDLAGKTILPNVLYEFDKSEKKLLNNELTANLKVDEIKDRFLGVSPLLASYLSRNNTDLNNYLINPVKNLDNNQFYWFNLFDTDHLKYYDTLSSLIGDLKVLKKVNKKPYERFIKSEINKIQNKLIKLEEDLKKHERSISLKEIADQIYGSGQDLNLKTSHFNSIPLDVNLTLNENAQNFYAQYKKGKSGISYVKDEIIKSNIRLDIFEELSKTLDYLNNDSELNDFAELLADYGYKYKTSRRRKKDEPNITKLEYLGAQIFVGKNSKQNEYIFSKIAKNDDLWLHVKAGTGAHVIIKGEVSSKIIEKLHNMQLSTRVINILLISS